MLTRQEQNSIIISKISEKLGDIPNVQHVISDVFQTWFLSLAQAGLQALQAQPAQAAEGGGGGQPQ